MHRRPEPEMNAPAVDGRMRIPVRASIRAKTGFASIMWAAGRAGLTRADGLAKDGAAGLPEAYLPMQKDEKI